MQSATWRDVLSAEEIKRLREMSDWRSWLSLCTDWGIIFGSLALVAAVPKPLTIAAALFLIGARQLGLAVLMHEAAHRSLFKSRAMNDWVGQWLCAYPVWSDLKTYRAYHLQHHAKNWTKEDPDLMLAAPFPVTRASMRRKILRDLTGRTAWKRVKFVLSRVRQARMEGLDFASSAERRSLLGMLVTNGVLFAVLALAGHPVLYLLWVTAWFTTHHLVIRLRSISEHAMVPDPADELKNTRTTLARWWERLLLAPNRVNFHLEHHLLMTVPHYNLPRLHRMLRERGVLENACVEDGYWNVLRLAASKG